MQAYKRQTEEAHKVLSDEVQQSNPAPLALQATMPHVSVTSEVTIILMLTCEDFMIVEAQCQSSYGHHLRNGTESEVLFILHFLHVLQTHGRMPTDSQHNICRNVKTHCARLGSFCCQISDAQATTVKRTPWKVNRTTPWKPNRTSMQGLHLETVVVAKKGLYTERC